MSCNCENKNKTVYLCGECGDNVGGYTASTGEVIVSCNLCKTRYQELQMEMDYYKELYEQSRSTKYDLQY